MIYLKNPLCLGMEESEYKEMLARNILKKMK